jgi:hypothetical protein
MAEDWTREEVEATVADYLAMLSAQHMGQEYSKADHRRGLGKLLNNRSDGAIERKHQNISGILIDLGLPYIDGYKPLRHYQQILVEAVEDRLRNLPELIAKVAEEVERPAELPSVDDILSALVEAPRMSPRPNPYSMRVSDRPMLPPRINYLAIEADNRSLGRAGEEFVVRFEVARLIAARQERLAARIEHVAVTRGDGDGYDVLSFETTGQERFIEVKTTAYGSQTPFFVTRNELAVSQEREAAYHLYRVFGFRKAPKLFKKQGRFDENFAITPEQYLARIG